MGPTRSQRLFFAAVMFTLLSCATAPKGDLARLVENREISHRVRRLPSGHGSGVVVSGNGHIITAAHVIGKNQIIEITVNGDDGEKSYVAEVIEIDYKHDLALIKIPRAFAVFAALEDPKNLQEGDLVYNIGFPHNLERVVGRGSIMKLDFDATIDQGPKQPKLEIEDGLILDIPDGPGTSGSGVFGAKNGKLVGFMCLIITLESKGYPTSVLKVAQSVEHARKLLEKNGILNEYESGLTVKEPPFRFTSMTDGPEWNVTVKPHDPASPVGSGAP